MYRCRMAIGIGALTALITVANGADAAVVYTWQALSAAGSASGSLSITDAAYSAGSFDWSLTNLHIPPDPTTPGPVTAFTFNYFGGDEGSFIMTDHTAGAYQFIINVLGSGLTGSIDANNAQSDIHMSSDAVGLWTILQANTDAATVCQPSNNPVCRGDTGRWLLTSGPASVPEPESGLLALCGVAALLIARQWSRTRHSSAS